VKKIISVFLGIALMLLVSSCKNNSENGSNEINEADKEKIPPYEIIMKNTKINIPYFLTRHEDKIILSGLQFEDNARCARAYTFDSNGELLNETELWQTIDDDTFPVYAQSGDVDSEGNIWLLTYLEANDEITNELFINGYKLMKFDSEGSLLDTVNIEDLDIDVLDYETKLIIGNDDNFYIHSSSKDNFIHVFDPGGNALFSITEEERVSNNGILKLSDGRVAVSCLLQEITGVRHEIRVIDEINKGYGNKKWEMESRYAIVNSSNAFSLSGNDVYDIMVSNEEALYGVELESMTYTEIINWKARGVDTSRNYFYKYPVLFSDKYVYSLLRDEPTNSEALAIGTVSLIKLTKAEERQTESLGKKKVTLSAFHLSDNMINAIANFNKANPNYHIEAKTYKSEEISFDDAIKVFNTDIISGNTPDIVILDGLPNIYSYASKEIFADLYELMDKDPDVNREDYVSNIMKAFETDDELYVFTTAFSIITLIGKTVDVGADMGWTWDDYNALLLKQPAETIPIGVEWGVINNQNFLEIMISGKLNDFVNYEPGECYFESSDFIELLKIANSFPAEGSYIPFSAYSEGNPLLMRVSVDNFTNLKRYEDIHFGEEITFIGFPTENGGSGATGISYDRFAISAKAKEPDGAWEFAKYLITDFQNDIIKSEFGFPVKNSAIEAMAFEAKQKSADGNRREISVIDGSSVFMAEVGLNNDKDNQKVLDLILSVTSFADNESVLTDIIIEEAAYYFAGQKSAEETAAVIQNRVGLYLAERG